MIPEALLNFFLDPNSYSTVPEEVNHIQTHISHVFIAHPYVYKIKKHVDLGFLDFSTLEKRRYYCEKEIELNSRLCSDIYLGVVPVVKKDTGFSLEPYLQNENGIVEYAVKMKRLKRENFLIAFVKNKTLTEKHLDMVSGKLAPFYLNQKPDDSVLEYGKPEKIKENTDENFLQTEQVIGNTITARAFHSIKKFTNRFLKRNHALLNKRISENRIVDGHGDLHLQHINIDGPNVCIYDCIEFNDRFRYQDQAADLAFLAMDLDYNHLFDNSRYFIKMMSDLLDDSDMYSVIDFYKCYRAYIRGKVKSMEINDIEEPEEERNIAGKKAVRYFKLSHKYALFGSKPVLIIFMGPVAGGKSTLAEHVSDDLELEHFMTDKIRKKMAGLPESERSDSAKRNEIYNKEMSEKTYTKMIRSGFDEIEKGKAAVLDGTFSMAAKRMELVEKCESEGIDFMFIEVSAPAAIRRNRLKQRETESGVISDARLEDMDQLDQKYDPGRGLPSENFIRIDTSVSVERSLNDLYAALIKRHLNSLQPK